MLQKRLILSLLITLLSVIASLGCAQEDIDLSQTFSGRGLTFIYPEGRKLETLRITLTSIVQLQA